MTPGGSSSPFLSFSLRSSVILRSTSICREVISSTSSIFSMRSGSFSLSFWRLRLRVENFAAEKIRETLETLIREDADFVGEVLLQLEDLRGFDGFVPLVLLSALAGEDFDVHDRALDARRAVERSIANVAGFFAEDGAEQLFFRSERGLALGRDLADKNVAGLHDRANADDTAFVEVAEEGLADVGNVASDFLGTELGITRFDFILLDVNRGVVIVFDQFFAHEDGVLEVVAAPGEKRHENVAAKREFAT